MTTRGPVRSSSNHASGDHSARITAVEIGPHCATEEVDAIDADGFLEQQFDLRMVRFQPRLELAVLQVHGAPRVVFMVSCHIEDWFLPALQQPIEGTVILERYDIACQDQDIPTSFRR